LPSRIVAILALSEDEEDALWALGGFELVIVVVDCISEPTFNNTITLEPISYSTVKQRYKGLTNSRGITVAADIEKR
jgi:hypothetical protein